MRTRLRMLRNPPNRESAPVPSDAFGALDDHHDIHDAAAAPDESAGVYRWGVGASRPESKREVHPPEPCAAIIVMSSYCGAEQSVTVQQPIAHPLSGRTRVHTQRRLQAIDAERVLVRIHRIGDAVGVEKQGAASGDDHRRLVNGDSR